MPDRYGSGKDIPHDELAHAVVGDGTRGDISAYYGYVWRSPDGGVRVYTTFGFDEYVDIPDPERTVLRWEKGEGARGTTVWVRAEGATLVPAPHAAGSGFGGVLGAGERLDALAALLDQVSIRWPPKTGKSCEHDFLAPGAAVVDPDPGRGPG